MTLVPTVSHYIDSKKVVLWISPDSTMAEIQRFVGLMGVFNATGSTDPLRFSLTPKKGIKSRLLYQCQVSVVRGLPHPRFSHPTTGKKIIRLSEAIAIARVLTGIPPGERLTTRELFYGLHTKG